MRFTAVSRGGQGLPCLLTLIEIHRIARSLHATNGFCKTEVEFGNQTRLSLFSVQGVVQQRQRRDDGGLCAQDQSSERSFQESAVSSQLEFRVAPATLPPHTQDSLSPPLAFQNFSHL